MVKDIAKDPARERRLQRKASAKGSFVATFHQVFLRHGLSMGLIALACGILPVTSAAIRWSSASLLSAPLYYLAALPALLLFFVLYLVFKGYEIRQTQLAWLAYLLFISAAEEFVFRLILPSLMVGAIGMIPATIFSNLLFASIHFVTLRWKLISCVGVFFAGLGLSRLLTNTEDLVLVVLVHWMFTFLNTPTPPNRQDMVEVSEQD